MSSQTKFLESNKNSIEWRFVGPNLSNCFDSSVSNEKLESYSHDKYALMDVCQIRAVMDETIIIKITNLGELDFETDHPSVQGIEKDELRNFLLDSGIWDEMSEEFVKMQEACGEELENRLSGNSKGSRY